MSGFIKAHIAGQASIELKDAIDGLVRSRGIKSGDGPAMAYFETVETDGDPKRYAYISFGMNGPKGQGAESPRAKTVAGVIAATVASFGEWLKPARMLVWRHPPEIYCDDDGQYSAFFRCVQLDDARSEIAVKLWFC